MTKRCLQGLTTKAKRLVALALAVVFVLSLSACKDEPKQVQHSNSQGGYSFSCPETWRFIADGKNTQISIADVGGALPYAVVRFTVFDNAQGVSAADYWTSGVDGFARVYEKYKVVENKRGSFEKDGVNSAFSAVINVTLKGETKLDGQPEQAGETADYTVQQLVFEGDGRICVASYMSSTENFDNYSPVMDNIKESFAFTAAQPADGVKDAGAAEFTIPTPNGWTLETAQAYYRLSCGKASIITSVFSMSENVSAAKYWEATYSPAVKAGLDEYTEVEVKDATLGGVTAVDAYYTGKSVSGNKYNFRQAIAVYYGQVYIITLTADDADYPEAVKGFESVVAGFEFK